MALTGCASGGGGGAEEPAADLTIAERLDSRIAIELRNNLIPATSVIVKIRSPGRPVMTLGTQLSDTRETYVVETSDVAAGFVIIAERPGRGRPLVTRRISVISRAVIRWDLSADLLRIERL